MNSEGAVRFWQPAAPLRPYISGYHRYALDLPPGVRLSDAFYPAWMNLRFTLDATEPWSVRIGRRTFSPVPDCALFGPTSHAGYVDAPRGILIGVGLTPPGWARLIGGDASRVANRVVPLAAHVPAAASLMADLADGAPPDRLFDGFFLAMLRERPAEEPAVEPLFEQLADPQVQNVGDLAATLGLTARQLMRVSRVNFGFTPKLLLRRARFVRALTDAMARDRGQWAETVRQAGYFDQSHFLRDCHLFLGQTLGQFEAMPRPLNRASAAARRATLGAPMQSMHDPAA